MHTHTLTHTPTCTRIHLHTHQHTHAGAIPLVILKHVAIHRDLSPSTSDGADSAPGTLDSPQGDSPSLRGRLNPDPSSCQKPKHPKTEALVKGGVPWVPFEQLVLSKKLGSVRNIWRGRGGEEGGALEVVSFAFLAVEQ